MSTMAHPEQVPPTVLAHVMACSECESERRPRMFVCSYHEGWWDGWDAADLSHNGGSRHGRD